MLFVGEECRGIGQYVDGLLFITVYGEKSGRKFHSGQFLREPLQNGVFETVSFWRVVVRNLG